MNRIGGRTGGVGRDGDSQGANRDIVRESRDATVEPDIGVIAFSSRIRRYKVGIAQDWILSELKRSRQRWRTIQRNNTEVNHQHAQWIITKNIGRDGNLDGRTGIGLAITSGKIDLWLVGDTGVARLLRYFTDTRR